MITVHHLENSRSQRVLWLLEELGLPYEVKRYARNRKTLMAPPELKQVHALGKSPVITDGDITVAESGAIIEYLLDAHGNDKLRPAAGTHPQSRSSPARRMSSGCRASSNVTLSRDAVSARRPFFRHRNSSASFW